MIKGPAARLSLMEWRGWSVEDYKDALHQQFLKSTHGIDPYFKPMTYEAIKEYMEAHPDLYGGGLKVPQLLESLRLPHNAFSKLHELHLYPHLTLLDLGNNRLTRMEGLDHCRGLQTLILDDNYICRIEGLAHNTKLITLSLKNNRITRVDNLEHCFILERLNLGSNHIGTNGIADILHLADVEYLKDLDLRSNVISVQPGEELVFFTIFAALQKLKLLSLNKNPVRGIKDYRYKMIFQQTELATLDDQSVEGSERHLAEVYLKEGHEAEMKERSLLLEHKHEKEDQERAEFLRKIKSNHKPEAAEQDPHYHDKIREEERREALRKEIEQKEAYNKKLKAEKAREDELNNK